MRTAENHQENKLREYEDHGKDKVKVTIDGTVKSIHRGSYIITDLKAALEVYQSLALDEVINGKFEPLDDSGRITIKGGEIFVSHVRQGGSS
jgi:hypothetical protein